MIVVSRVIERIAAETGNGTLRASFQRLSRLEDERGTYEVYETVSEAGVDVYGCGVGDADAAPPADHAALVALETEPNVWDGFWTFRPELVTRIERYIAEDV